MSSIQYETDMDTAVAQKIDVALLLLDDAEILFQLIDNKLSDTSKWSGEAHDVCSAIHELVKQYEQEIRPICEQLVTALSELDTDVAGFKCP